MQTYTLKVIDLKNETADTLTLCLKQPALKKIKYKAGQYLTLIFKINGRRYIRPYSFSSAPSVDDRLEITIKRVPNGIVSNHIYDLVKVGDSIEVMSPMGDFVLPEELDYQSIFLWGAGSGVTPLISIAKESLKLNPTVKVNLIYGNRNKEATIFYDSIKALESQYPASFKVLHFHTQLTIAEGLPYHIEGRINPKTALSLLKDENLANSLHFICGPLGLKASVKEVLHELRVSEKHVFSEDFELVKNPKEFEEIETENIQLSFLGNEMKLEVTKGKSILEVALDAGLELPYSCQTGSCSTCKAILKEGALKMIGLKENRTDLKANEFLLCCSYPLNSSVHIEI